MFHSFSFSRWLGNAALALLFVSFLVFPSILHAEPAQPDLLISDATLTRDRITFHLRNSGTVPAAMGSNHIRYEWLDADGRVLSAYSPQGSGVVRADMDQAIDTGPLPSPTFAAGDSSNYRPLRHFIYHAPLQAASLRLTADPENLERNESDESNNTLQLVRPSPGYPASNAKPDLSITSHEWLGDGIRYVIGNVGSDPTAGPQLWVMHQWLDAQGRPLGEPKSVRLQAPLIPGGSFSFDSRTNDPNRRLVIEGNSNIEKDYVAFMSIDYLFARQPYGASQMKIILDPWNDHSESDEANNILILERPLPDFVFRDAAITPTLLTAKIFNDGPGVATSIDHPNLTGIPLSFSWIDSSGNILSSYNSVSVGGHIRYGETGFVDTNSVYFPAAARDFIARRPAGTHRFRISIRPSESTALRENNTNNNSFELVPPAGVAEEASMSDLFISDVALTDEGIVHRYGNRGEAPNAPSASKILYQWLDSEGGILNSYERIFAGSLPPRTTSTIDSMADPNYIRLSSFIYNAPQGASKLRIKIDPQNQESREDESDNQIEIAKAAPDFQASNTFPDLRVENVAWLGDHVRYTILNAGGAALPGSQLWILHQWLDDNGRPVGAFKNLWVNRSIPAGGSIEIDSKSNGANRDLVISNYDEDEADEVERGALSVDWRIARVPQGSRQLKIVVDPWSYFPESDESNNVLTADRGLPDFVIRDVSLRDDRLTWKLFNEGQGVAPEGSRLPVIYHWLNTEGQSLASFNGYAPGILLKHGLVGEYDSSASFQAVEMTSFLRERPQGATTLSTTLNRTRQTEESSFSNNEENISLDIPEEEMAEEVITPPEEPTPEVTPHTPPSLTDGADLVPENIQLNADGFSYDIVNRGNRTIPAGPFIMVTHEWMKADGSDYGSGNGANLMLQPRAFAAGERLSFNSRSSGSLEAEVNAGLAHSYTVNRPAGATTLRLRLDPNNLIAEADEANTFTAAVPASLLPDLAVNDVVFTDGILSYRLVNRGSATRELAPRRTAREITVTHRWVDANGRRAGNGNGPVISHRSELAENASVSIHSANGLYAELSRYLSQAPADATRLQITVDEGNAHAEQNEENNIFDAPLPLPDLAIEDVRMTNTSFTYDLINRGPAATRVVPGSALSYNQVRHEWLDAQGAVLDDVNLTLQQPLPAGSHLSISSQDALYQAQGFHEFALLRPTQAAQLRITLDTGNHQQEVDESNNQTLVQLPLPNLYVQNVSLDSDALRFAFGNNGLQSTSLASQATGEGISLSFQWLTIDGQPATRDASYEFRWLGSSTLGAGEQIEVDTKAQYHASTHNREVNEALYRFIANPPSFASQLRLTIDYADLHRETDENDNVVIIPRPLPDLTIENIRWEYAVSYAKDCSRFVEDRIPSKKIVKDLFRFDLANRGRGVIPAGPGVSYFLEWLDDNGAPIDTSAYHYSTALLEQTTLASAGDIDQREANMLSDEVFQRNEDTFTHYTVQVQANPELGCPAYTDAFSRIPDGAAAVRITLDKGPNFDNLVPEANEENNVVAFPIPRPDFVIRPPAVSEVLSQRTAYGNTFNVIGYTLLNTGRGRNLLGSIDLRHEWLGQDGQRLGEPVTVSITHRSLLSQETYAVNSLEGGFPDLNTFANQRPPEARKLLITIDPDHRQQESEPLNNSFEVIVITPDIPAEDLVEADETVTPEDVEADDTGADEAIIPEDPSDDALLRAKEDTDDSILKAQSAGSDAALDVISQYVEQVKSMVTLFKEYKRTHSDRARTIALEIFADHLKHQIILGKLEHDLPPAKAVSIKPLRQRVVKELTPVFAAPESDAMRNVMNTIFLEGGGSPFRAFRHLEILELLKTYGPAPLKTAVREAAEDFAKDFIAVLERAGRMEQRLLQAYLQEMSGDEVLYLKALETLKTIGISEKALESIQTIHDELMARLQSDLQEIQNAAPEQVKDILTHTDEGNIEDALVVRDILENLDTEGDAEDDEPETDLRETLEDVSRDVEATLKTRIESLDTEEKQNEFLKEEINDAADVRRLEILTDIQENLSGQARTIVDSLRSDTLERVVERVNEIAGGAGIDLENPIIKNLLGDPASSPAQNLRNEVIVHAEASRSSTSGDEGRRSSVAPTSVFTGNGGSLSITGTLVNVPHGQGTAVRVLIYSSGARLDSDLLGYIMGNADNTYSISGLLNGTFFLTAFHDSNGNGTRDADEITGTAENVVVHMVDASNVTITLSGN